MAPNFIFYNFNFNFFFRCRNATVQLAKSYAQCESTWQNELAQRRAAAHLCVRAVQLAVCHCVRQRRQAASVALRLQLLAPSSCRYQITIRPTPIDRYLNTLQFVLPFDAF